MNVTPEQWKAFEVEFYRDGSLRDIYILDTQIEDWNRLAAFIAQKYSFEFSGGWQGKSFK